MAYIIIDKETCKGCSLCIKACPKDVIEISGESNNAGIFAAIPTSNDKCIGCSLCAIICPDCCITVHK